MMTRGELRWSVRESFRQYIDHSEGTILLSDGAEMTEDGRIAFPQVEPDAFWGNSTVLRFGGGVEFSAHEGLLSVRLRSPWVVFDDSGATLTFMHPAFRDVTDQRQALCRLEIDAPDATATQFSVEDAPTVLLIDGSGTFDNLYRPGDAFAPVSLRAQASEKVGRS